MDLFIAGCQGLGLALAAGALLGAPGLRGGAGLALALVATVLGALLFGASLTPEDHPAWPGWVVGAPAALLAHSVARELSLGAQARAEGTTVGVAALLAGYALALAGVSLLVIAPLAIFALLAIFVLAVRQRGRARQKHAGLRSLR